MADEVHNTVQVCSACGVSKPLSVETFRPKRGKCRECERAHTKQYNKTRDPAKTAAWLRAARRKDPERYQEYDRRNAQKNRPAGSDYNKRRYASRDKEKARAALKKWKAENPDKVRAMWERTYEKNKHKHREKSRKWRSMKRSSDPEFREKANKQNREWHRKNKEALRPYYRNRAAACRRDDVEYRIKCSLRRRVHRALKGKTKNGSVIGLLGCSIECARRYIESLFLPGMTWENWGRGWDGEIRWHIDHIKPLVSFDLTDETKMAIACHYTNLQPLWSKDNLVKGAI